MIRRELAGLDNTTQRTLDRLDSFFTNFGTVFDVIEVKQINKLIQIKMKKVLFLIVATLVGFATQAQDAKPGIKFVVEEIDYGTITQGANGVRVFEFKNTGNAPLIISNASSTCGCTVPSFSREPIAPGAKGKIEVKYNTDRLGAIRKTITVTSNAVDAPTVYLKIKGEVVAK